ncbi:MAG: conjugal transfer protein TraF [Gammaproteobacteria bacterium]|nr:conjugal transfer protein TraF [Gammaproteobacteria bacterium]
MRKLWIIFPYMIFYAATVHAVPFMAMDARAMAMGGTGVASADFHNAPLYNPALLGAPSKTNVFALGVPFSARFADPNDLQKALTDFKSNDYQGKFTLASSNFDTALNAYSVTPSVANLNTLVAAKSNLASAILGLNNGFRSFSDKPAEINESLNAVLSIAGHHWGAALTVGEWAAGGLVGHYAKSDADTLDAIVNSLNQWDNTATGTLPTLVNFTSPQMQSSVALRGVMVIESGIAFGKKQNVGDEDIYWGVTPKVQQINSFDALFSGATLGTVGGTATDYLKQNVKKQNGFNLDTGVGYIYERNWRVGATIKNLLPMTYKTALNNDIKIVPALRIGGAYQTPRLTGTLDLDITENDPAGIGDKSRYLAIGGEVDVWIVQIRAGARTNLSNTRMSSFTAGLGLNLWLLHADVGAMVGSNELAAAAQLGMNF